MNRPYVSYHHIRLSNDSLILAEEVPAEFGNVSQSRYFLLIAVISFKANLLLNTEVLNKIIVVWNKINLTWLVFRLLFKYIIGKRLKNDPPKEGTPKLFPLFSVYLTPRKTSKDHDKI